jgi:hypothetical protein
VSEQKAVTDLRKHFDKVMFSQAMQICRTAQKSGNARMYVEHMMDLCRETMSPLEFTTLQRFVSDYIEAGILVL